MQKWLHPSLALEVRPAVDSDGSLFGKDASDLQNIYLGNGGITGTLNYIADYSSAFGGDLSSGHYIALKCEATAGATITVEIIGGTSGAVTLDSDGLWVGRIANNSQSIQIVATKDGKSVSQNYSLAGINLA